MTRIEDSKVTKHRKTQNTIEERAKTIVDNVSKHEQPLKVKIINRVRRIVQGKLSVISQYDVRATYDVSKTYKVVIEGKRGSCVCPDYIYRRKATEESCKHMIAAQLKEKRFKQAPTNILTV